MPYPQSTDRSTLLQAELLEGPVFTLEDLARACRQDTEWVRLRVETGVLQTDDGSGQEWRFSSHSCVRARRIAELEAHFDADPQLAALTADLIEEVNRLRRELQQWRAHGTPPPDASSEPDART